MVMATSPQSRASEERDSLPLVELHVAKYLLQQDVLERVDEAPANCQSRRAQVTRSACKCVNALTLVCLT